MRKTAKYVGCVASLEIAGKDKLSAIIPICEFVEGDKVVARKATVAVLECKYQIGDEVQVEVDEEDPDNYIIVGTVIAPQEVEDLSDVDTEEYEDDEGSRFSPVHFFLLLFLILILLIIVDLTTDVRFSFDKPEQVISAMTWF